MDDTSASGPPAVLTRRRAHVIVVLAVAAALTAGAVSVTGYLALGLLIDRVTAGSPHEQGVHRIALPLDPAEQPEHGERSRLGAHPHGSHVTDCGGLRDLTPSCPSLGWSAGTSVLSLSEFNRFMQGLFVGDRECHMVDSEHAR